MVKKAKSKSTGDLANPLSSSQQSVESTTEDHRAKGPAAGSSQAAKVTIVEAVCDQCKVGVTPIRDNIPTKKAHIVAAILFIIGLPFLTFLPYALDSMGSPVSRCPKCNKILQETQQRS